MPATIDTLTARIRKLEASKDPNAVACAFDAHQCLQAHHGGHPFPGIRSGPGIPTTWLESAEAWVARGAQYLYGFYIPESW